MIRIIFLKGRPIRSLPHAAISAESFIPPRAHAIPPTLSSDIADFFVVDFADS